MNFGYLTVMEDLTGKVTRDKIKCQCVCGKITYPKLSRLVSKKSPVLSCGCQRPGLKSHRMSKSSEFKSWRAMKQRCYYPKSINYERYGGRGIKVCDRWINSFENFLEDMGERPFPKAQLDRINNDGNYEPGNCRWVSLRDNSNNREKTLFVEYMGEKLSLHDCIKKHGAEGINYPMVWDRIKKGWPLEEALTKPQLRYRRLGVRSH